MALQTEPQWKSFFTAAGITTAATLDTYAKAFVDNQVTENSLSQLDKDALTELGITTIGHRLSILHAIKERVSSSRPTAKASVTAKLTPLSSDMTHPQFRLAGMYRSQSSRCNNYSLHLTSTMHVTMLFKIQSLTQTRTF